jgi:PAS domain-containing protein
LSNTDTAQLRWYECHGTQIGTDTLYTGFDATKTVQAETQLRDFMQTLTKTFAELDTGLAIFDKSRHLALFNPALAELTQLPIEFLTSKPSLVALIDKLREKQMAPEPRDFKSWRQSIAELESAAESGTYSETWALPGNRTYRVSGRPHPDGAIAFLIEDISAEMSLTRRFRADLETGQAVIDNLDDAIAVFAHDGSISITNQAYRTLWGTDPDSHVIPSGVVEATRVWHGRSTPTPIWGDFRDFVENPEERAEWSGSAQLIDGRALNCRFVPLSDGGTQVIFSVSENHIGNPNELLAAV